MQQGCWFVCLFFFQAAASIVEFLVHFKVIFVRFRYLLKYENEVEGIFSYILLNNRKKSYMVSMCILQKLEMTQTVITNFTLMDESLPLTSVKRIILEFRN